MRTLYIDCTKYPREKVQRRLDGVAGRFDERRVEQAAFFLDA